MHRFRREAAGFVAAKEWEASHAGQVAAVQLICGVDLDALLGANAAAMSSTVGRLERAVERERLKGWHRHWSYDLNRHIALKQALDRLKARLAAAPPTG